MRAKDRDQGERQPVGQLNHERRNWNLFAVVSGEPSTRRIGLTRDDLA